MNKFLAAALTILFAVVFSFGQTTTGQLTGTVSGPDGVLPGATVTATDNKTGKAVTVTADEEGGFRFQQLEFGTYTVVVTASGFKTFTANELKIDVGREYKLEPRLEVGSVQENVTITAGADVVTSTTAQVSNTVSPQQILSLPLVTRNPLSLTALQAGVSANSAQVTTINGMRTTFTNITRDGINIQDNFIRTNATDFAPGRPSVDDTGEFTITTTNAEADQGYGGAQIRLVTPRGTKDFHGALFAYNRNSKFAANNFFNNRSPNPSISAKPPFRNRNQYGGKLSGPLWVLGFGEGVPTLYKDKAYFFFAYEGIKDPQSTATNGTRTILTPSALGGAFKYNRTNTTDVTPFCPSQAIGTLCTIPNILSYVRSLGGAFTALPSTTDPVILARVLSQLPTESNFTGGDNLNTAGYRLIRRSDQTRDQYSSRIDVDIDDKNTFHGIYNYNKELNLRPDADTTKFTVVPGVEQFSTNIQFTMAYRRIISSNFVNEVRGGVFTSEVPFDRTDDVPDLFFGSGTLGNTVATSAGIVSNPENTFMTQGRNTKTFNFQDNADYVWGKHTFRFGGQSQIFRVNSYNDAAIVPIASLGTAGTPFALTTTNIGGIGGINATQLATANGLLALFGGVINQRQQSFNIGDLAQGFQPGVRQFQPFRFENHSLYFSDRWSVTRELTLTLGVRYELFPALRLNNSLALEPILDENDVIGSLVDRAGQTQVLGGNAGRKNAYYKTDYNNFAPNIGFAWAPNFEKGVLGYLLGQNKTVIRGGYSQIFGNDSIVTSINNAGVGTPGLARTTVTEAVSTFAQNGLGTVTPPTFIPPPRSYLFNNGQQNNFATVFGIDPNLETPMIEQYSFGVQREFFGNTALEVRYVGSRSKNLVRGIDLNQIDIFNNGFLNDFLRAQQNFAASRAINAATATPFCGVAGSAPNCTPLTIFQNGGAIAPGRLPVGTNGTQGVSLATFVANIQNGTPADLALAFINSAANLNNHPCAGNRPVTVPAQPACNPNATPSIPFLRNPAAGAIDLMLNDANYNYNSLQIEIRRRFANGLYFQANYTFSKNLTNAIGTSQALFEPYLDNNNPDLDNQRADFDQTHVFNFNGIYQLPFGKGKMFLNQGGIVDKVFGGWEISGLGTWTSGAPITFVDTRGTLNRNGRSARQTPFSNLTNDQIRALGGVFEQNGNIYFINPSILNSAGQASPGYLSPVNANATFPGQVFFSNVPGQTGNVTRALLDGPKFFNVNMALLKNIRFTETMRVQLRAEAFNVFNNVNFNISAAQQLSSITSTTFGQLTSTANAARELQFAVRFEF
jgi:hypothetical protein